MTDVLKIAAAAITTSVAAFLLREMGWRGAVAFSLFGAAVFLSFLSDGLGELGRGIGEIVSVAGVSEIAGEILKIVGASYVFGISSDICQDLGERTLSTALVTVGRVEILLIALPYFIRITRSAVELVGGEA